MAGLSQPLSIAMLAPMRERCGIADYTRLLIDALRGLPEIRSVFTVPTPEEAPPRTRAEAAARYLPDETRYNLLGASLNQAEVAHIQHQYFFFGGVAPHKNHLRAVLNAVRVPVVMTVHEIASSDALWQRPLIEMSSRLNFVHPAIKQIIVHTEHDEHRLRGLGVRCGITVIPLAVPPPLRRPVSTAAKLELGLAGRRVALLFGFFSAKKGHLLALEALRGLPSDVSLLFAGDKHPDDSTDYGARLRAWAELHDVQDRVVFTGYLPADQIPTVMAAADLGLAPFLESSGSASLAHLFAYGVPVLASDIPPHREIVARSPGSLSLFQAGDASALAAAARRLLESPLERDALRAGAAQFAFEHSITAAARQTVRVYCRAAAS